MDLLIKRETMPGTGNLGNRPELVKPWVLEKNTNCHFIKTAYSITTFHTFVLRRTDKCTPHSSSRKLLFAADGDHYRKPQPIKMQSCGVQFQRIHRQHNFCSGTMWKSWKRSKDREVCCEIVSPRSGRSYTHKLLPAWLPTHGLNS